MKQLFDENGILTDELIDRWAILSEDCYLKLAKKRADHSVRIRLSVEEMLLRFRSLYGNETNCRIRALNGLAGLRFEISQRGSAINPLEIENDEEFSYDLLSKMNLKPRYIYRPNIGLNVVNIPASMKARKNAMLIGIFTAALLSILTLLLSFVIPDSLRTTYLIPLIGNLFSKFSAIFSALATPLVFFAVISGICGIGEISSFGKLGSQLLRRMLLTYLIAVLAMIAVGIPMGLLSSSSQVSGESAFSDLLKLVLDIIPDNLVLPFSIDNDLQVITLAVFIGLVMLMLGNRVSGIRSLFEEASTLCNQMMLVVCKVLPLFVYLGLTNLLLNHTFSEITDVSKIFIISLVGAFITICITIIRTLVVTKISPAKLFSAQLPSLIINLTTSSQVSAMPESMKCCKEKWGIDDKFTDFGLSLGIVVYMPNGAIMLGSMLWVLIAMSTGGVGLPMLIRIAFVAVVVAIAAPPIPGSAFVVMPVLFSACGVGLSMMPLAVIVASTFGYLLPAMNGFCLQEELLMAAFKADKVKKLE